jgi:hypothetical protein
MPYRRARATEGIESDCKGALVVRGNVDEAACPGAYSVSMRLSHKQHAEKLLESGIIAGKLSRVCRETGLEPTHVRNVLYGRGSMSLPYAYLLANALGITLDDLWKIATKEPNSYMFTVLAKIRRRIPQRVAWSRRRAKLEKYIKYKKMAKALERTPLAIPESGHGEG